jgi:hypothetical protein
MSIIQTPRFNWLPQPSLYAQARAWTDRRQALRQSEEFQSSISDSLAAAATDQSQGMVNIAAQVALQRTQTAAKSKVDSVLNPPAVSSRPSSSSRLTLPDGSTIKLDPTIYLPGGSKLNLDAGTLTLSNGTVIDTVTGARRST